MYSRRPTQVTGRKSHCMSTGHVREASAFTPSASTCLWMVRTGLGNLCGASQEFRVVVHKLWTHQPVM